MNQASERSPDGRSAWRGNRGWSLGRPAGQLPAAGTRQPPAEENVPVNIAELEVSGAALAALRWSAERSEDECCFWGVLEVAAGRLLPAVGLAFVWNTIRNQDMVTIGTTTPDEAKDVIDLSVTLADDLPTNWPGKGVGNHRQPYMTMRFGMNPNTKTAFPMQMMDSHAGTHLVPPAYALPPKGFDDATYSPEVRGWLREYEKKYGPRGTSDITAEKVLLDQTCGPARVIDVKHLLGTTRKEQWPASPEISVADIRAHEKKEGALTPGDLVIFQSGWTDKHYRPLPGGAACMDEPLNGKREGWPAPGPDAIAYLAGKGIRCVGTDAPTLGGVTDERALMTYWILGTKGMVGVEFLTNLGSLKKGAYVLFAPVKVRDCHGGPGRAIAFQ